MTDSSRVPRRIWVLVAILLLAFTLRLYRLGTDSLWYDETVSVHLAGKSIPELVAHTAGDIHPPGYYMLLHAWLRLAGESEFAAAYASLFFGLVLVALAYRLGAEVFDWRVGLLAALLVAVSPYNLWYSQEVRMYTLGATLGACLLLAVISLLTAAPPGPPSRIALAVYVVCGALGLWTLYYFAFLLVAINLMAGVWWLAGWRRGRLNLAWLGWWLLAQCAVLLLYAPWIPMAWRQATQPPVPPWRGFIGLDSLVTETWTALSLGQSAEAAQVWPVLLLLVLLFGLGLIHKGEKTKSPEVWVLAGFLFLPVLLIYLASFFTPLYHVRYAYTYSIPFYILVSAGLLWLGNRWRPALALGLVAILIFSGLSIYAYHVDNDYASDDHRAAVRFLAERWRPGDAVLVNAGYAYPALLAYWDGDPITWRGRLGEDPGEAEPEGPSVVQTGTLDGDPALGWGDPSSDFYAMSRADATEALEELFGQFDRVWVYRIYDTVTDPEGFVRRWLEENGTQFVDQVFTGESQLRVQGFLTGRDPLLEVGEHGDTEMWPAGEAVVDGSLELEGASWPPAVAIGDDLDLALTWKVDAPLPEDAILFAGLFDQTGPTDTGEPERWAQVDERPLGLLYNPGAWAEGSLVRTPLSLPVLPGTPPGRYRLEAGWYRFEDGQPVWLPWTSGQRVFLGEVDVQAPDDWAKLPLPPVTYPAEVTIGETVRLLGFDAPILDGQPGAKLGLDLYWQALDDSPESGVAVLRLSNDAGDVLAEAPGAPLRGRVPFTSLVAGQTLRDPREITLPGDLPSGVYNLLVGRQQADGNWLPVQGGPLSLGATYPLATVRVLDRAVDLTPPNVQYPVHAGFGAGGRPLVQLVGYDLQPAGTDPGVIEGSHLQLTLHWQAQGHMNARYKTFVHLVGDGGRSDIRAQVDSYPALPTTSWVPGEYLVDHVDLDLPDDLPIGHYRLLVGLYEESTGERLLPMGQAGESSDGSLVLREVTTGK